MIYTLFLIKRRIEGIFIAPFIWMGKAHADKYPLTESYDIYFFFPFYHTGGAEKVHAQIAMAFADKKCLIIFTRRSHDDGFRKAFEASGHRVLDISAYTDQKRRYWKNLIWRGVVSTHINRQKTTPLVFNGQCNFAYKCSPWIRKAIPQIELIHSFNSFSWIRIPFLPFYRQTVMISRKAIADHDKQYEGTGIPRQFFSRIMLIQNGIPIPETVMPKTFDGQSLRVLYVGRATPEKRVQLVAQVALQCRANGLPISFSFLGDIRSHLTEELQDAGHFYGSIDDPDRIREIYASHEVLVITSSEEGFPMVVMEGMAMGCIILATPVGDLPHHITQGKHGYVFSATDEKIVRTEMSSYLSQLLHAPGICQEMSVANRQYALDHFGISTFTHAYRQLAENLMPSI